MPNPIEDAIALLKKRTPEEEARSLLREPEGTGNYPVFGGFDMMGHQGLSANILGGSPDVPRPSKYPSVEDAKAMGPMGVIEALKGKRWNEAVPIMGSVDEMIRMLDLRDAVRTANDPKALPAMKAGAQRELQDFLEEAQYKAARGQTFWAKVANTVVDMVPYMAEFVAGGPIASVAKGAVAGPAKAALKKYGTTKLRGTAIRVASRGVGWTAAGAARTATMSQPSVIADTVRNEILLGDSPAKGYLRAFTNGLAENMSETAGPGIGKTLKRIPVVGPGLKKFDTVLRKTWTKAGLTEPAFDRILKEAGYNGVINEMGEERVGDALRALAGIQDFRDIIPSLEQLGVEGVAFSVPAAAREGASYVELAGIQENMRKGFLSDQTITFVAKLWPDEAAAFVAQDTPSRKDLDNLLTQTMGEKKSLYGRWSASQRKMLQEKLSAELKRQTIPPVQPVPAREPVAPPAATPGGGEIVPGRPSTDATAPIPGVIPGTSPVPPPVPPQKPPSTQKPTPAEKPVPPQKPPSTQKASEAPYRVIADWVEAKLTANETVAQADFWAQADAAYGGTRAEGKYGPSDAYDALELGMNRYLKSLRVDPGVDADEAKRNVMAIADAVNRLPTQVNRSGEKDAMQQFSTPPHYAYIASWLANIRDTDVVLEPSAGTGGIAVFPGNRGAYVVANELSENRRKLLNHVMELGELHGYDAEHIHRFLHGKLQRRPTVVVMNPPFSRSARVADKVAGMDLRHIDSALELLDDGGRLVAIVGAGMRGIETKTFKTWYNDIRSRHNVRAVVYVGSKVYRKYGTGYPTRMLVIDKTGPSTADPVIATAEDAGDLMKVIDQLEEIRNGRRKISSDTTAEPPTPKPGMPETSTRGEGATGLRPPEQRPTDDSGTRPPATGGRDSGERLGGSTPATDIRPELARPPETSPTTPPGIRGDREGVTPDDTVRPDTPGPQEPVGLQPTGKGSSSGQQSTPKPAEPRPTLSPRTLEEEYSEHTAPIDDVVFEDYKPSQRDFLPEGQEHPTQLVESAAMAAVAAPPITYLPPDADKSPGTYSETELAIPLELIRRGVLSREQIEAICYAAQGHQEMIATPDGRQQVRRAWLCGDGTGVGKGRIIAGIILDNFRHGRRKAVWMSENTKLLESAVRDWTALEQDPAVFYSQVTNVSKQHCTQIFKRNDNINIDSGILFTTYATATPARRGKPGTPSRLQQLVDWLGPDFDGVLVFDEVHKLGNALQGEGRSGGKASGAALMGLRLQELLPNARVVYLSATAATEVRNLGFGSRLGLWGRGTPFPDVKTFVNEIVSGGIAAMEMVAQSMKAQGLMLARTLSLNDGTPDGTVQFDRLDTPLSIEQINDYDKMCEAWQLVIENITKVIGRTNGQWDTGTFYNSVQRFFESVLSAYMTPAVIKSIEADLSDGKSAVVQLISTFEAATDRSMSRMREGETLEDLELGPKETLMNYVLQAFPVEVRVETTDANGNTHWEILKDPETGKEVLDPEAVRVRDELLHQLSTITLIPEGPMDMIISHFGSDAVGEVSGRKARLIYTTEKGGVRQRVRQPWGRSQSENDVTLFRDGKKRILIFSQAGGTGASYHASRDDKNQQQRHHYLLQPGWRANVAIQGLGRTHRTNQASAPIWSLLTTDVKGHRRFISTIARRVAQMGAITRGQRSAQSSLFTEDDNMESEQAVEALGQFLHDIITSDGIPATDVWGGMSRDEFARLTGLRLTDSQGRPRHTKIQMKQFLNRLLCIPIRAQNGIFDAFEGYWEAIIAKARADGTLDTGIETLKASSIDVVDDQIVHVDERSGATTRYVKLKTTVELYPIPWSYVNAMIKTSGSRWRGFYRSSRGTLYAVVQTSSATIHGRVTPRVRLIGVRSDKTVVPESRLDSDNWSKEESPAPAMESLWETEIEKAPKTTNRDVHLITGALLPIWDRLHGYPRIYRVQTSTGHRFLGRIIPKKDLPQTLRQLGATQSTETVTPEHAYELLHSGEAEIVLVNSWRLQRRMVGGETRIELKGLNWQYEQELMADGVIRERVGGFNTRYFVPVGDAGPETIARIVKSRPIVDVIYTGVEGEATEALNQPTATTTQAGTSVAETIEDDEDDPFLSAPADIEKPTTPISEHSIIRFLSKVFKVPIVVGRVGSRSSMAIYKIHSELVVMKGKFAGNLHAATHEVAHHIEKTTKVLKTGASNHTELMDELGQLDYEPEKARAHEGFAEFISFLLTSERAKEMAPEFYNYFRGWLMDHSEIEHGLLDARKHITDWRAQGAMNRGRANLSFRGKSARPAGETVWDRVNEIGSAISSRLYAAWKDDAVYARLFETEARQRGYNPRPGESVTDLMSAFKFVGPAFAKRACEEGVFSLTSMRSEGPSLANALKDINPDEYEQFSLFLWARHAREVHRPEQKPGRVRRPGMNPGMSDTDARKIYQELLSERFEKAATGVTRFNNALIGMLVDAGVIAPIDGARMVDAWETYVPLMRIRPGMILNQRGGYMPSRLVNLPSPVHRRYGSGYQVIDPIQSTILRAAQFYQRAAQQIAINTIMRTANATKGLGGWVAYMPPSVAQTSFRMEEVLGQIAKGAGIDVVALENEFQNLNIDLTDFLYLYRPVYQHHGSDPIARVIVNGTPRMVRFNPELYRAINGMNSFQLPYFLDLTFGKGVRLVKLGATGLSLAFGLRNPVRDYGTYLFQ